MIPESLVSARSTDLFTSVKLRWAPDHYSQSRTEAEATSGELPAKAAPPATCFFYTPVIQTHILKGFNWISPVDIFSKEQPMSVDPVRHCMRKNNSGKCSALLLCSPFERDPSKLMIWSRGRVAFTTFILYWCRLSVLYSYWIILHDVLIKFDTPKNNNETIEPNQHNISCSVK